MSPHDAAEELVREGFATVTAALSLDEVRQLIDSLEPLFTDVGRAKGGVRDVFNRCPELKEWCGGESIRKWVEPIVGQNAIAVNATLFDKAIGRNWKVPFHQDVTIRVKERKPVEGFETWWGKDGVPHVWPNAGVLEKMIAVRIHLDDCDEDNGPLRVIPRSHSSGILNATDIERIRCETNERVCPVSAGDLLLMRPLLLHASSTATTPRRRRVLHLEYAIPELPGGLEWYDRL
jgi:ectoine hydroxylase-related dioxygenase (phytanoyl-CoA dioxygenase family)